MKQSTLSIVAPSIGLAVGLAVSGAIIVHSAPTPVVREINVTAPVPNNDGCQVEIYDDGTWDSISYRKMADPPCPTMTSSWKVVFVHGKVKQ